LVISICSGSSEQPEREAEKMETSRRIEENERFIVGEWVKRVIRKKQG